MLERYALYERHEACLGRPSDRGTVRLRDVSEVMTVNGASRKVEPNSKDAVRELVELLLERVGRVSGRASEPNVIGRAAGNALLIEGQALLERTSTDEDCELFVEVFSREPADVTNWSAAILSGLAAREYDEATLQSVVEPAETRAICYIEGGSPLAYGSR